MGSIRGKPALGSISRTADAGGSTTFTFQCTDFWTQGVLASLVFDF